MKHNGIANLFLGFIYGGTFTYVHAFVDSMDVRVGLMLLLLALEFALTCFLYGFPED